MLHTGNMTGYSFRVDNWGTDPATTYGTLLTANATPNSEGAYSTLIADTSITSDCYWMHVMVHTNSATTAARNVLLDLAVDPAGGTSFTNIISNIVVGDAPAPTAAGLKSYIFPYYIKAGSELGARIQSSIASVTSRVAVRLYGQPTNPLMVPRGTISQTMGTITNSNGQSFTPGNAADGSWVDLGATSYPMWWWQLGYQIDNGTITAEYTYIEVAWGDASNKHTILKTTHGGTTAEVAAYITDSHLIMCEAYMPVPAGANIYIRGRCNNAPDTGYNATVIGIGG